MNRTIVSKESLVKEYIEKHPDSKKLHDRAVKSKEGKPESTARK